jgi:dTDP-4-dehydrorhamnose reductase
VRLTDPRAFGSTHPPFSRQPPCEALTDYGYSQRMDLLQSPMHAEHTLECRRENRSVRLLVLGGSGMLGHKLCQSASTHQWETVATVRAAEQAPVDLGLPGGVPVLSGVDAANLDSVKTAIARARPDIVVNCIGIVKQSPLAQDPIASITVNALFPHQLARICRESGARLIHVSTDCVFSGRGGHYVEGDASDAEDLYGRSKFLGEVAESYAITLRTSMIGRELHGANGLVEWFLSQRGKGVKGFRRSIFSGFTTTALSKIILDVVIPHPELTGVWHVAADPISKHELLSMINDVYDLGVCIEADDAVVCDRSLDGTRFVARTGFVAPPWRAMIEEMAQDPTPYEQLRRLDARR